MNYEIIYLILVCTLFCLAISDLVVGVSNDAVNFLSSAVGSKSAPIYVILIVASVGILIGATFSSGMMEVARSGIFHPNKFYFNEIMLIFLAVVVSDVLLLDLFNTFGLPTSTTVSMVFELLGAAVGMAIIKICNSDVESFAAIATYINTTKASAIVFSILASVFVGFLFGMLIQFLVRCLFSFKTRRTTLYFGAIWGGLCLCLILYFLIFKGMKGSSLIKKEFLDYLSQNIWYFLGIAFAVSSSILLAIQLIFKYNPLKIVVLAGTFALAMAFAGNDLVNFIGVSMAGLDSYAIFRNSGGGDPSLLNMSPLAHQSAPTAVYILFIAGVVMVSALWFSKKAKAVLKTTVNLSSKNSEDERFAATPLSRSLVKMFITIDEIIEKITPNRLQKYIASRFKPDRKQDPSLSFDLVRASVNLMVAASLIVFGTSLKLPLSTTYVTFMVAMGTSLSDGAWGRENAVYRVTGVFTVIVGWFMTALAAFCISIVLVNLFHFGGVVAIVLVLGAIVSLMVHSRISAKKKEAAKREDTSYLSSKWQEREDADSKTSLLNNINEEIISVIGKMPSLYELVLEGLEKEDLKILRQAQKNFAALNERTTLMKDKFNETLKLLNENKVSGAVFYVQVVNYLREMLHSLSFIIDFSYEHTDNKHKPMLEEQILDFRSCIKDLSAFFEHLEYVVRTSDFEQIDELNAEMQRVSELFDHINKKQVKRVKRGDVGTKSSVLFLRITSNAKNMLLFAYLMAKANRDFVLSEPSSDTTPMGVV